MAVVNRLVRDETIVAPDGHRRDATSSPETIVEVIRPYHFPCP